MTPKNQQNKKKTQQPIKPNSKLNYEVRTIFCPTCNKKTTKTIRVIDAPNFRIEEYECDNCRKRFRITS